MPRYVVTLRESSGEESVASLDARTPHLAVRLAEEIWRLEVVSVMVTYHVVGKCGRCGAVLFRGDVNRGRGGVLWCGEC